MSEFTIVTSHVPIDIQKFPIKSSSIKKARDISIQIALQNTSPEITMNDTLFDLAKVQQKNQKKKVEKVIKYTITKKLLLINHGLVMEHRSP